MEQQQQFGHGSGQQPQQPIQGSFRGISSQVLALQNPSNQNVRSIQGSSSRNIMNSRILRPQTLYNQNVGSIQIQGSSTGIISSPMSNLTLPPSYQYVGSMPGSSGGITPRMLGRQVPSGHNYPTLLRHSMMQKSSQSVHNQIHPQSLLNSSESSSALAGQQTHLTSAQILPIPILNSFECSSSSAFQQRQSIPAQIHHQSPLFHSTGSSSVPAFQQRQSIPAQIHHQSPLFHSTGSSSVPAFQQTLLKRKQIQSEALLNSFPAAAQIHPKSLLNSFESSNAVAVQQEQLIPTQVHPQPLATQIHPQPLQPLYSIESSSVPAVQRTHLVPSKIHPRPLPTQIHSQPLFAPTILKTQQIPTQIQPQPLPTQICPQSPFYSTGNSSVLAFQQTQLIPTQIQPQPLPTQIHHQPLFHSSGSSSAPGVDQRTKLIPTQIPPQPLTTQIHSQPLFNSTGSLTAPIVQQTQLISTQQIHPRPVINSVGSRIPAVEQTQLIPTQIHPIGSSSASAFQQTQLIPTQVHPISLLHSPGSSIVTALQQTQSGNSRRDFKVLPQLSDIPIISKESKQPPNKKQRCQLPSPSSVSKHTALQRSQQHDPTDIQPTKTNRGSDNIPGRCFQRLVDYTVKMRERPQDNNIEFWKNFVSEFYAKDAKMKWCVSSHGKKQNGVSVQEARNRGLCQVQPGRDYEVSVDAMPKLCKTMYDNGATEKYRLEEPSEYETDSGLFVLQSSKVTHETVFQNQRVVCEGSLCIVFTPDLKICIWEFCGQHNGEFMPWDHSLQIRDGSRTPERGRGGKNKSNFPLGMEESSLRTASTSGRKDKSIMISSDDLGCEKQFARSLQTSEVVGHKKDLMIYTDRTGASPRESTALFTANSIQQPQLLLEQLQSWPRAENVTIAENASPSVPYLLPSAWNHKRRNEQHFPEYDARSEQPYLSGLTNFTASTAEPSHSFTMPPSARNISPNEICVQQQEAGSSLAPFAANMHTDIGIFPMAGSPISDIQLDSPNHAAETFEQYLNDLDEDGPDGMQMAENVDDNANGNGGAMTIDGSNSGGSDAIADSNNAAIPDYFEGLLLFLHGDNAPNLDDI